MSRLNEFNLSVDTGRHLAEIYPHITSNPQTPPPPIHPFPSQTPLRSKPHPDTSATSMNGGERKYVTFDDDDVMPSAGTATAPVLPPHYAASQQPQQYPEMTVPRYDNRTQPSPTTC
eukprot:sb/3476511/